MNSTESILCAMYEQVGAPVASRALPALRFSVEPNERWTIEECSHDVFPFLCRAVNYNADVDQALAAFHGSVEKFCGSRGEQGFWVNTYEDQADLLSGVVKYFAVEGSDLRFLQVHDGGDARRNYSRPRVFDEVDEGLYENSRGYLSAWSPEASECPAWFTSDGETWVDAEGGGKPLSDYEATTSTSEQGNGKLYVDPSGTPHCPLTGGRLRLFTTSQWNSR